MTPPLVALYVPGDRPDRYDKATSAGADLVIIDLEDAVAPTRKLEARTATVRYLGQGHICPVAVRINGSDTLWHGDDLAALGQVSFLSAVRVPKVEAPTQLRRIAQALPDVPIQALIESARGIENISAIATGPGVASISLGEADIRSDLAISDPQGLDWIRTRIVIAARAAQLPPPMMSVYPSVSDLDGLAASCVEGRARGFLGRMAIHPKQIPVIRNAFRPTQEEVDRAEQIVNALKTAEHDTDTGVVVLQDGSMVDAAMKIAAERTIALAETSSRGVS